MSEEDPLFGATPAERLDAVTLTTNTPLVPRFIRRAVPGFDEHLSHADAEKINKIGDQWRCQVGKYFSDSGTFEQKKLSGEMETVKWKSDNMFLVLGVGSTFREAFEMATKTKHQ